MPPSITSRNDLFDILTRGANSSIAQSIVNQENEDLDIDSDNLDEQTRKLHNQRYSQDTEDRKWLASWATTIVSIWLFFVLFIVAFNHTYSKLSDTVLSVLLGTTTLNVLGLSFIVLRGHFNSTEKNK